MTYDLTTSSCSLSDKDRKSGTLCRFMNCKPCASFRENQSSTKFKINTLEDFFVSDKDFKMDGSVRSYERTWAVATEVTRSAMEMQNESLKEELSETRQLYYEVVQQRNDLLKQLKTQR